MPSTDTEMGRTRALWGGKVICRCLGTYKCSVWQGAEFPGLELRREMWVGDTGGFQRVQLIDF